MLVVELKLKDRKREAQEKRVKDLEEMRNKQQQEQERRKLGITIAFDVPVTWNQRFFIPDF